jgi:integrase
MASISTDSRGNRKIQFFDRNKDRKALRLGKVTMKVAQTIMLRVESLLTASRFQVSPDAATVEWVNGLEASFANRLAELGLIPKRHTADEKSLGPFLDEYVSSRIDTKHDTRVVWGHTVRQLKEFFGPDRELPTITEGEADEFKLFLIDCGLSSSTVSKRLQVARMFFRAAKRRKLILENPFDEVRSTAVIDKSRHAFVDRESVARVLVECDRNWRIIVTLCRFAGLRCPSEVLSLRWRDIDWLAGKMLITSPKTEHHEGKDSRLCPLFPEVREALESALATRSEGSVYVVESYRQHCATAKGWRQANLRTQFERILKRAGVDPWPRLFHGMRASCETELLETFPNHVVAAWLGHSVKIQEKHYATVRESDFARACGEAYQKATQSPAVRTISESSCESLLTKKGPVSLDFQRIRACSMAGTGFEPATSRL